MCLAASCAILVWGFQRLIKTVKSGKDNILNKAMIGWHIVAYFFVLTANIVQNFMLNGLLWYEVSTCCQLAINLICSVILALIVTEICSKALQAKSSDWIAVAFF